MPMLATGATTRSASTPMNCGAKSLAKAATSGLTQRARVEYSLNGGRINTDFIDNSAGVDSSDREVNIKILVGAAEQAGIASHRKQRDKLLADMTDDVAKFVLRNNYLQTQSISMMEARARERLAETRPADHESRENRACWIAIWSSCRTMSRSRNGVIETRVSRALNWRSS